MNDLQKIQNEQLAASIVTAQPAIGEDLFRRFLAYLDASPKTTETYTKAIRQLFKYLSAHGIEYPQREDIIAYKDALKATGHKPTTIQNYITAAKLFFKWTEQEGLYPNIAEHIKGAKLDREHKKDYLSSQQVKAVLEGIDQSTLRGMRDYAILLLMVTGGLRTIEIARANVDDIRTLGENCVLYVQGKGRQEKTEYVKISFPIEQAIRKYLTASAEGLSKIVPDSTGKQPDRKRSGSKPLGLAVPLFISLSNNNFGQRMTTRAISGIVKQRFRAAGYDSERLTAHSLRHTAVTLSLLAGKDITEVQQFARHANISTTMIYNHSLDKAKNSCSEAIARSIF